MKSLSTHRMCMCLSIERRLFAGQRCNVGQINSLSVLYMVTHVIQSYPTLHRLTSRLVNSSHTNQGYNTYVQFSLFNPAMQAAIQSLALLAAALEDCLSGTSSGSLCGP